MLKTILLFAVLVPAYADPGVRDLHLTCDNQAARVQLFERDSKFYLHYENGIGFANFPVFTGVLTPAFLPNVNQGVQDLSVIQRDLVVVWDSAVCQSGKFVQCNGVGTVILPKKSTLQATSFFTSLAHTESADFSSDALNINLALAKPGESTHYYFLALPFAADRCSTTTAIDPLP